MLVSCTCPVEVSQSWLGRYLFELIGLCYSCFLGDQISQPSLLTITDIWVVLLLCRWSFYWSGLLSWNGTHVSRMALLRFFSEISFLHNKSFLFLLHGLFLPLVTVSCTCPVEVSRSWLGRYLFELIGLFYSCYLGGQFSQHSLLVSTDIWLVLLFM